jgi:hypothetical protein
LNTGVARMNLEFGGKNPDVSRVLYTHGTFDGWTKVAAEESFGPDAIVIMIEGGVKFCFTTQPSCNVSVCLFRCGSRSRFDLL